jgi:hypothetical protein
MRLGLGEALAVPDAPVEAPILTGAFGLDLELALPVPGLGPGETAPTGRDVVLDRAEPGELAAGWESSETVRLRQWNDAEDGHVEGALDMHPEFGYRLFVEGYGEYTVSPDGAVIRCAPPEGIADWSWQRALIGSILPLAAVLRGIEVFHASAVAVNGRAVGIVGRSTAGKSSVAVNLVLRGAQLLADDVAALEALSDGLAVHPGPGVVSVRHAEAARLGETALAQLGTVLGDDGEALRIQVSRGAGPLPLAALYFLEHRDAGRTSFERLWPPPPRLLLGSTFNYVVLTAERLTTQLDVCTRLAHDAPLFRANVAPDTTADQLAAALESHVLEHA